MRTISRRSMIWGSVAGAVSLVIGGGVALGQGRGGTIVFVSRRPPRDIPRNFNPRAWANGSRTTSFTEDTQSHVWRVNFMAFLPRPPNAPEVILSWFHIEANGVRRYVSNEPIALSQPTERVFFHTTSLHRSPNEFQPMERYEAVLAVNTSTGARELARGSIQLVGEVERRGNGVVDFTGAQPVVR